MNPFLILLSVGGVILLVGLFVLLGKGQAGRGALRRLIRRLLGLSICLTALLLISAGIAVYQYIKLDTDLPVATISTRAIATQKFELTLSRPDGRVETFRVLGDEWQLDARIVRWKTAAWLAGAPPIYRLERLSGRYGDTKQELSSPRSVFALDRTSVFDISTLQKRYPQYLPFVDARFGSAAYLPMLDGATYEVYYNQRGGLVARPADRLTERLLDAAGW